VVTGNTDIEMIAAPMSLPRLGRHRPRVAYLRIGERLFEGGFNYPAHN
jgi:hypothetical protein